MTEIAIVGAGIGGLSCALALHRAGIPCKIYESTRQLKALGLGINLLPHAVKELAGLGLEPELAGSGVATAEMVHYDRHGNRIFAMPRGRAGGNEWPQYSIHRGQLQMILLNAVIQRLGSGVLHTGKNLVRFEQNDRGVSLHFEDRSNPQAAVEVLQAKALIAADGLHSVVRRQLHPQEPDPFWNGILMWRGASLAPPFLNGKTMILAGSNRHSKFVAYPISANPDSEGRVLINWVAETYFDQRQLQQRESWSRRTDAATVLAHFRTWRFDWLDIPALIQQAPEIIEYPMVDRDPLPQWGEGRVTLLGDAAHPMYPVGSNGGSQAIIDAAQLACDIQNHADITAAFSAYEARRRPATADIVLASRMMGPEKILDVVAARAPQGFERIEDVLTEEELLAFNTEYAKLIGKAI